MRRMTPDELLTTTRTVRKRLDLTRPVPPELVRECLEIALQAPSGSNRQHWHWIVVTDPEKRAGIAEVYRRGWDALPRVGRVGGDAVRRRPGARRDPAPGRRQRRVPGRAHRGGAGAGHPVPAGREAARGKPGAACGAGCSRPCGLHARRPRARARHRLDVAASPATSARSPNSSACRRTYARARSSPRRTTRERPSARPHASRWTRSSTWTAGEPLAARTSARSSATAWSART